MENSVDLGKEFKAFERVFAPLKFYSSKEETRREVRMETLNAMVVGIEPGVSRNNQDFHRIKLDNGQTLYSYHPEESSKLKPNQMYQFNCIRRGRFLNIENFEMVIDQQNPNQAFDTGIRTGTDAPFDDTPKETTTGGFAIETPSPAPQPNSGNPPLQQNFATASPTEDKNEVGMRRGAITHGSLGNIVGGLAKAGRFDGWTPEQIVAEMIYYAQAIEHWCKS